MENKIIKTVSLIEYPIFQLGFSDLLRRIKSISYQGNISKQEIHVLIQEQFPDILFIGMKEDREAMQIIEQLREKHSELKLAVFLNSMDKEMIKAYMDLGVNGLIMKSIDRMELEYALQVICNGGMFVSQEVSSEVFNSMINNSRNNSHDRLKQYHLTPREVEIMLLVFQEYCNHEIALRLKISPRTVEAHRTNILNKTGVKNSIGLAKFVIEHKLDRQAATV